MKNRTVNYFEGKLSQILSKNPDITIHELAIAVLRNQRQSKENEFYLDVALVRRQEYIIPPKEIVKTKTFISIAA